MENFLTFNLAKILCQYKNLKKNAVTFYLIATKVRIISDNYM